MEPSTFKQHAADNARGRLECCDVITCKDAKEARSASSVRGFSDSGARGKDGALQVDGCSGTAWKKKPNFEQLEGAALVPLVRSGCGVLQGHKKSRSSALPQATPETTAVSLVSVTQRGSAPRASRRRRAGRFASIGARMAWQAKNATGLQGSTTEECCEPAQLGKCSVRLLRPCQALPVFPCLSSLAGRRCVPELAAQVLP